MRGYIKRLASLLMDGLARMRGFHFPEKFTWRWKWEMLSHRYEYDTTKLFKEILKEGMTVVDVGAHIGYFTRLFSHKVGSRGHVFAFEPDPENLSYLKQNIGGRTNVTIVPKALSSKIGTIAFFHIRGSTGCHTTVAQADESGALTVEAATLDMLVDQLRISKIDLVKIDIEGGEWLALDGMEKTIKNSKPMIICEYNPEALEHGDKRASDLLDRFAAYGYQIYAITKSGNQRIHPPYGESILPFIGNNSSINIFCSNP